MVDVDSVESLLVLSHGPCCSHDSISQDLHIRKSQWVGELGQLSVVEWWWSQDPGKYP